MKNFIYLFVAGITVLFLTGCAVSYAKSQMGTAEAEGKLSSKLLSAKLAEMEKQRAEEQKEQEMELLAAEAAIMRKMEQKAVSELKRELELAQKTEAEVRLAMVQKAEAEMMRQESYPAEITITAASQSARVESEAKSHSGSQGMAKPKLSQTNSSEVIIIKQGSSEYSVDAALLMRRETYLRELKQASYAFNPPSPVEVATPVTVFFWLDPLAEPMRLAEELKATLLKMRPNETAQTEAGRMEWSPTMRASLTCAGEDFVITPTEGKDPEGKDFNGVKSVFATRRTGWSWDVKAKHVGQQLPLHLRVWAVLPPELGAPVEVLKLDKLIHVDVTFLWLLNEYWEKYWKWILGGLGTALSGAIATWWKCRQPKGAGTP